MKKLAILLTFAVAAASSDAFAADPPVFGPRPLMDTYEMPSGPLTGSVPASERVVVADPVPPPGSGPGAAWLQAVGDFMAAEVNDWQRPAANAYDPMLGSLDKARGVTGRLNHHNLGAKRKQGRRLVRKTRGSAKELSRHGGRLDMIDKGGAVVSSLTALYFGDTAGAVQEAVNSWLSGVVTTSAGTAGVWVGGVFGSVVAGPPGAMVFGTAGGMLMAGIASFSYDETFGAGVNWVADDYLARSRENDRREQALQRARSLVSAAEKLVGGGQLTQAEDKANKARNALVLAGQGGTSAEEYDEIRELSRRVERVLSRIAEARRPQPTPTPPTPPHATKPRQPWVGTWVPQGNSPLGRVPITIYKEALGYKVMPDHGLPRGVQVRGLYSAKGTGREVWLEWKIRLQAVAEGGRASTRNVNTFYHNADRDRLILRATKFEARNGRPEKKVQDFQVELRRK